MAKKTNQGKERKVYSIEVAYVDDDPIESSMQERVSGAITQFKRPLDFKTFTKPRTFLEEMVEGYAPNLIIMDTELGRVKGYALARVVSDLYGGYFIGTSHDSDAEQRWQREGFLFLSKSSFSLGAHFPYLITTAIQEEITAYPDGQYPHWKIEEKKKLKK